MGTRSTVSQPYTSDWSPWTIAANGISWIESENYDRGSQGVAYNDSATSNQGGQYRTHENIGVEGPNTATDGTYDVAYVNANEWLDYTVNVVQGGNVPVGFADLQPYGLPTSTTSNGVVDISSIIDGITTDLTPGNLTVPNTGGWQTYTDVTATYACRRHAGLESWGGPVRQLQHGLRQPAAHKLARRRTGL